MSILSKLAKGAVNFLAGGVISFVKKPTLKTAGAAAFDVATTVVPVGKGAKLLKFAKPVAKAIPKVLKPAVKVLGTVAKAVIPKTTKGKLIAAVAVPTAIGALQSSPTARKTALNLVNPAENIKRGQALGGALEKSPDKSKLAEIATKGAILGGGAAALAAIPFVIGKVKGKEKEPQPITVKDMEGNILASSEPALATVPATTTGQIKATQPSRRRKSKQSIQNISQRVSVNVSQRNSKKYLNKQIVAIAR